MPAAAAAGTAQRRSRSLISVLFMCTRASRRSLRNVWPPADRSPSIAASRGIAEERALRSAAHGIEVGVLGIGDSRDALADVQHQIEERRREPDHGLEASPHALLCLCQLYAWHFPQPLSWKKNPGSAPSMTSCVIR